MAQTPRAKFVKPSLATRNRRLRKVAEHIVQHPQALDMGEWIYVPDTGPADYLAYLEIDNVVFSQRSTTVSFGEAVDDLLVESPHTCGTTACFAGHAVALYPRVMDTMQPTWRKLRTFQHIDKVHGWARRLLGLTPIEAQRLFLPGYWPDRFETALTARKTPKAKARVLQRRVEHFIATGE